MWESAMRALVRSATIGALAALAMTLGSASTAWSQDGFHGLKPFTPQPADSALKPGLTVRYYNTKVRYLDELVRFISSRPGTPGEPLRALDYADKGPGAYVLGTDRPELVAAVIDGLMRFDTPGRYELAFVINDCIQFFLDGQMLFAKDWDGTPSLLWDSFFVNIEQPGWYPLHLIYYQRKGTAALELNWKRPGQAGDLAVVPAEAYAYIAE